MAARSYTLTGSPPASQAARTGPGTYRGFALKETAGASASVVVWDNATTASGDILEVVTLGANASAGQEVVNGRAFSAGCFVQIVSGSVAGAVFV